MSIALPVAGTIVILAVMQDVFATVLFPSSGHGTLRKPVSRAVWWAFRVVSERGRRSRRRWILTLSGPVIITVNLATWVVLMVVGFALIYQPALGESIRARSGVTDTSWSSALYYSGFAGTTLGVGDLSASSGVHRMLTVAQAAFGFAGITMAITYFLSVYGNLAQRNAGAQALHHRTGGTGTGTAFVIGLADGGELAAGRQQLSATADYLRHVCQSHGFYPVLRYFHYADDRYALPRILLVTLDGSALLRTLVDGRRHPTILGSRSLEELDLAGEDLLDRLAEPPDEDGAASGDANEHEQAWRRHHAEAALGLEACGIAVAPDPDAYVATRRRWDHRLRALAASLAYDWDDIDVGATA